MNASGDTSLTPVVTTIFVAAITLAGAGQASAQSILSIHDEATGVTRVFTPGDATFFASGDGKAIDIDTAGPGAAWYLRFEAPEGEVLAPGRHDNAGCPFQLRFGRAPGLGVTDNNPVCSFGLGADTLWGSFVIRQVAYDPTGRVVSLEALFTQRKGSATAPALGGLIRYEARPLSLTLKSDPGFAWGAVAQENHGDTGLFMLQGTAADGLTYDASVQKDIWRLLIDPPIGRRLQAGRYPTRGVADAGHVGLLVLRGFHQNANCPDPKGRLDVQKIRTNAAGMIVGLRATFEYRCGGTRPALRGLIRYLE